MLGAKHLDVLDQARHDYPAYASASLRMPDRLDLGAGTPIAGFRQPAASPRRVKLSAGLPNRADVQRHRDRVGTVSGAAGNKGAPEYVRGTYLRSGRARPPGAETLAAADEWLDAATKVHPCAIVVPMVVYANVWLPGQFLTVHTDIPAFRGVEMGSAPAWLLVVMRHSGLFERWRIPIATIVMYPDECRGGEFTYFERAGENHETRTITPTPNSAVAFDGDTVFHQVERIAGQTDMADRLAVDSYLRPGRRRWHLSTDDRGSDRNLADFLPAELRYSLSWKAMCFPDHESHRLWLDRGDDLDLDTIVPRLVDELVRRGVLEGANHGLGERQLGELLIDEFVPFPQEVSDPPLATAGAGTRRGR